MKHIYIYTLLTTVILFLNGCGGVSPSANAEQTHSKTITINIPADTSKYYYALGEAKSIELAKNKALGDISSRILVSISSTFDSEISFKSVDDKEQISRNMTKSIQAKTKALDFVGVSIEDTQSIGELKRVLIKVDRDELYNNYIKKLQKVHNKIENEMSVISTSATFTQLKLSYNVKNLIPQANEYIILLQAMKPTFKSSKYTNIYSKYEKQLRSLKSKAIFSINSDKNSRTLATLIKSYMSQNSIKMGKNKANVKLYISTSVKEKKYKSTNVKFKNRKFVVRTTTFKVVDTNGNTISNHVIKTKASSSLSIKDAVAQTKEYEKLLNKNGLLNFISGNS